MEAEKVLKHVKTILRKEIASEQRGSDNDSDFHLAAHCVPVGTMKSLLQLIERLEKF